MDTENKHQHELNVESLDQVSGGWNAFDVLFGRGGTPPAPQGAYSLNAQRDVAKRILDGLRDIKYSK